MTNFLFPVSSVDVGILQNSCIMNYYPKFFKKDIQKMFKLTKFDAICWYFEHVEFFITKPRRFLLQPSDLNKILSLIAYPVKYSENI